MIRPSELVKRAMVPWNSGAFLSAGITGRPLFPFPVRFRAPAGKRLLDNFEQVRNWITTLVENSRQGGTTCYEITWQTIRHRSLGEQKIPHGIAFPSADAWLGFIGKQTEWNTFAAMIEKTRAALPPLLGYLADAPHSALPHAGHWDDLIAVCRWFMAHPRPELYLRQLDISGIDTKFIENHKAILMALLPRVMPPESFEAHITGLARHGFERRFGLRHDPPLVRLRYLDPGLAPDGFEDITVPLADLARRDPGCRTVFITENKINGLAFPKVPRAIVIFGLGYGVEMLPAIGWLPGKRILYWGDIDTHGFAILSQLRGYIPHVQSMLMDRKTLLDHRPMWVSEPSGKKCSGTPMHLTEAEAALYAELQDNGLAENVRLEQERIRFSALIEAIGHLNSVNAYAAPSSWRR